MAATKRGAGKPAWQRLTAEQKALFLEHLRQGDDPQAAAKAVKERWPRSAASPRAFRALKRFDERFEAAFEDARELGVDEKRDQLRATLWERVLSDDPRADRLRTYMARVFLPEWGRLRERVELTGRDGGPLEHAIDLTRLSDADLSEFERLLALAAPEE